MVTIQEVDDTSTGMNVSNDSASTSSNKTTEKNRKRRRQRKNTTKHVWEVSDLSVVSSTNRKNIDNTDNTTNVVTDNNQNKKTNNKSANTNTSTNNNQTTIETTKKKNQGNTNTNDNDKNRKQIEERKRKQQEEDYKDLLNEQRLVSALFNNGGHFIPSSLEKNNTMNDNSDVDDEENQSDSNEGSDDNVNENMFQIDRQGEEDYNDMDNNDDDDDDFVESDDEKDNTDKSNDKDDVLTNQPPTTGFSTNNNTGTSNTVSKVLPVVWVDDDDTIHNISLMDESNIRLRKLRTHQGEFDSTTSTTGNTTGTTDIGSNTKKTISGNDLQQRLRQRYQQTQQLSYNTSWATIPKDKMIKENDKDDDDDSNDNEESKDDDDDSVDNEEIDNTNNTNTLILPLQSNTLDIQRCVDANHTDTSRTNSVTRVVQFHKGSSDPYQPLIITAGLDKTLRFFQIKSINGNSTSSSNSNYATKNIDTNNGTTIDFDRPIAKTVVTSEKVQSMHFPKMPIYSANFVGTSSKVVITGRRPFIYIYDASVGKFTTIQKIIGREEKSWEYSITPPTSSTSSGTNSNTTVALGGNDGYIVLIDIRSKHNTFASIKLNGSVRAMTYTSDGQYIVASGSDSDIYWYDIRNTNVRCIDRYSNYNDGSITSSIAISNNSTNNNLAVGSESGVVNLYNHCYNTSTGTYHKPTNNSTNSSYQTPVKSIMNIKTSISTIKFNHDGQLLAIASNRDVNNAMRLLHTPTQSVYSNWPTSKTPLNYIWDIDFSPYSKFIALGNDKGTCLLYQLNHYY